METGELLQNLRQIVRDETALVIEQFAERMNARFDHVYTLFDGVFLRLDRLDSEYEALKAGLSRIEKRLVFLEERLTLVESELKSVRAGLAQLETRISALEEDSKQKAATQSQIFELTQQIALLNGRVAELEARRQ